jgi:hypothetical protein
MHLHVKKRLSSSLLGNPYFFMPSLADVEFRNLPARVTICDT